MLPLDARAGARDRGEADLDDLDEREHRYYIYDHFFDNCTTRLRDMIDRATGGKLRAGSDVRVPADVPRDRACAGSRRVPPLVALTDFVHRPPARRHADAVAGDVLSGRAARSRSSERSASSRSSSTSATARRSRRRLDRPLAVRSRSRSCSRCRSRSRRGVGGSSASRLAWATLYLALWGTR